MQNLLPRCGCQSLHFLRFLLLHTTYCTFWIVLPSVAVKFQLNCQKLSCSVSTKKGYISSLSYVSLRGSVLHFLITFFVPGSSDKSVSSYFQMLYLILYCLVRALKDRHLSLLMTYADTPCRANIKLYNNNNKSFYLFKGTLLLNFIIFAYN